MPTNSTSTINITLEETIFHEEDGVNTPKLEVHEDLLDYKKLVLAVFIGFASVAVVARITLQKPAKVPLSEDNQEGSESSYRGGQKHLCMTGDTVDAKEVDPKLEELRVSIIQTQLNTYRNFRPDQKLPWMTHPFDLDNATFNLWVQKDEVHNDEPIELRQLFDDLWYPRNMYIQGTSGVGKSTLCLKIIRDWTLGCRYVASKFAIIFLVDMQCFKEHDTFESIFAKECQKDGFNAGEVLCFITQYQREVLLILDGFDDAEETIKTKWSLLIRRRRIFKDMYVILACSNVLPEGQRKSFGKVITLKGVSPKEIKPFLRSHIRKNYAELGDTITSLQAIPFQELSSSPLLIILLATVLQEKPNIAKSTMTSLYKELINFIIGKSLGEEVDVFQETRDNSNSWIKFAKFSLELLEGRSSHLKGSHVLQNSGSEPFFFTKKGNVNKTDNEVPYKPIHRTFLEFSAAYSVFRVLRDSGEEAFKKIVARIVTEDLIPVHSSIFYCFLCGFLNSKAYLLYEQLQFCAYWFSLDHRHFNRILSEVQNPETFLSSFQRLFPSFVSKRYTLAQCTLSPTTSLILDHALGLNLIKFLQLFNSAPFLNINKGSYVVDHLQLVFGSSTEDHTLLKPKTLSVVLTSDIEVKHNWNRMVVTIASFEYEAITIMLDAKQHTLSLLLHLTNEFNEGKWKGRTIDRLRVKINKDDDPACLQFLSDLIKKERISNGVFIEIEESARTEEESKAMKRGVEEVFKSVMSSRSLSEFCVSNHDARFVPVLDFSKKAKNGLPKRLYFYGSLNLLLQIEDQKPFVEDLTVMSWGNEEKNSVFIKNLTGVRYLGCGRKCLCSLIKNNYQQLSTIEELNLVIDRPVQLEQTILTVPNLQILTLDFSTLCSTPSEADLNISHVMMASLHLKSLHLLEIPDVPSFDYLVKSVLHGIVERETQTEGRKMESRDHPLEEFTISFNERSNRVQWPELKGFSGMRGVKTMLQMKMLRRWCWADARDSVPRKLPSHLFPLKDGFRISVDVGGMDLWSSRQSQHEYRWLFICKRYCVTFDLNDM